MDWRCEELNRFIFVTHESGGDSFTHEVAIDVEYANGLTFLFAADFKFSECAIEDSEAEVSLTHCTATGPVDASAASWGLSDVLDFVRDEVGREIWRRVSGPSDPWEDAGVRHSDFI
tara:strand:+ start:87 stop:437 length:351 start_codon:yes stop_codon:yes gene_type:complete